MIFSGSAKDVGSHQAVGEKDNNQMHVWNVEVYSKCIYGMWKYTYITNKSVIASFVYDNAASLIILRIVPAQFASR